MFSESDIKQIGRHGLTLEAVQEQIERFKKGYPYLEIIKPAGTEDGILRIDHPEEFVRYFHEHLNTIQLMRFVPASGAASRMFKSLYEFLKNPGSLEMNREVREFILGLDQLALKPDLEEKLEASGQTIKMLLEEERYQDIIRLVLESRGLNYGNLPKALLKFHRYSARNRTALEEHLAEGALYNKDHRNNVQIHFTISPEHRQAFENLLELVKSWYEKKFGVHYDIDFSYQKPSTDTIAVDLSNQPFRTADGCLLFRPGGHGALLENLNDLDADLIFIKNIDNVAPDRLKDPTVIYKKVLAGILLQTRAKIFSYLQRLESEQDLEQEYLDELESFIKHQLNVKPGKAHPNRHSDRVDFYISILNRPIRVCGMVRNEGEPGGGPFFAKNANGTVSLQVVESSQINLSLKKNRKLLEDATHFNPVDLVCSVKDHHGRKYDLRKFRDENTGFISVKSSEGRDLKALEWPGLWNGAMSDWTTIFVEVPIETFNPVKSINDLLRPIHQ